MLKWLPACRDEALAIFYCKAFRALEDAFGSDAYNPAGSGAYILTPVLKPDLDIIEMSKIR